MTRARRPTSVEPEAGARRRDALRARALLDVAERGAIVTSTGDVVAASDAPDDELVAWLVVAERLGALAKAMRAVALDAASHRAALAGGSLDVDGVGAVTLSRLVQRPIGKAASVRVRELLAEAAAAGLVRESTVDAVAPLEPAASAAELRNVIDALEALGDAKADDVARSLRRDYPAPVRRATVTPAVEE